MNIEGTLARQARKINRALRRVLPKPSGRAAKLEAAMRYAVLSDGKRLRPILTLAACEASGGHEADAMSAACAIELIHNYSLVHDDLPSMDDDRLRRGKPTCHVRFGEATAILAGDALLTLAFQMAAAPGRSQVSGARRLEAARLIAQAAGVRGMVGGQAADMAFQKKSEDLAALRSIHARKTAALIAVSAEVGAYLGGADARRTRAARAYGQSVGLLFQIVDDIMDDEGYAKILGRRRARAYAERLLTDALKALSVFGKKGRVLAELAGFALKRTR